MTELIRCVIIAVMCSVRQKEFNQLRGCGEL